jgi:MSHA biogenesis protein MshN
MSLLNDMLRDLSHGRPVVDGVEGYDNALLQSSSFTQKKSQPWLVMTIFFVVIFTLVLGVNYAWHKFSLNANQKKSEPEHTIISDAKNITPVAQSKITIEKKATNNQTDAHSNIDRSNTAQPNTEPVQAEKAASDSIKVELQNHINDLLQQAERAMRMDRLTAPVEDNAYGYYQKILTMDAENNDAKDGLDQIASRLLIKAQEQMQLGNSVQADALVQRARFVSARFVQAHENFSNDRNSVADYTVQVAPVQAVENQAAATKSESIKPFVVAESPTISVSPNAGWKDEQLVRHAETLIQKGQQTEAQALLKNFIATEKSPALSTALLAEIYIQQGNTAAADIILEQTNYLPVDVKAKLKAQILSANGDDAQAITLLEKSISAADNNEGYRSLLASLYHKTANYQQSIISYQRLNNSFGEKPAYWLGLALAYDGLSQHKSALQAYQHLREFPQLQAQVKQYTDQRIAALRSE